ncbi:DJ-1/PfpI family protein [Gordonia sp. ABSL1-1]|uniref:GlxA family transcriptional regulator n=1 Tax=Gordonia sp. ABSL1-1 TaxID=3053923 RepID=UPI0025736773|nr:helix-turn-helix domain-containing protein [Gordonia sp. ABSL1-1]MDL9935140.1 DJ-1/PfpI family protein [Gordonia sp. ABSL1-1]
MTRSVVVLGFGGVQPLDVTGPIDVFTSASVALAGQATEAGEPGYTVSLVSVDGAPVDSGFGLQFVARPLPDPAAPIDTLVIPGGMGVFDARRDTPTIDWLRRVSARTRRVVTVCSGAFLAAEAGLLDGARATTHWSAAAMLADDYPAIEVDPEPIFIRSTDRVWTAAGVTAGIDLSLALVEDDHGTDLAQLVARWLVLHLRRPGGQSQFAPPVWMPRARRQPIREVQEAIERDPGASHRIPDLARLAAMSPRHFTRVFTAEVGEAPGTYVERIRTDTARRHLEETDDPMPVIAARTGFGSAETMRRTFVRRIGVAPDQYRRSCR